MGKQWKQWDFIFLGSKITVDGNFSHELKIHLLLGSKALTNLDSVLENRDHFASKGPYIKAMVFPVVMYRCENWTIKKAEHQRIDAFKLWSWRRILRVPWIARRSNQSILKEARRRRGWHRMIWLGGIINSVDMSLSKVQEIMKNREAWHAAVHGITKSRTQLSNWTTAYSSLLQEHLLDQIILSS